MALTAKSEEGRFQIFVTCSKPKGCVNCMLPKWGMLWQLPEMRQCAKKIKHFQTCPRKLNPLYDSNISENVSKSTGGGKKKIPLLIVIYVLLQSGCYGGKVSLSLSLPLFSFFLSFRIIFDIQLSRLCENQTLEDYLNIVIIFNNVLHNSWWP